MAKQADASTKGPGNAIMRSAPSACLAVHDETVGAFLILSELRCWQSSEISLREIAKAYQIPSEEGGYVSGPFVALYFKMSWHSWHISRHAKFVNMSVALPVGVFVRFRRIKFKLLVSACLSSSLTSATSFAFKVSSREDPTHHLTLQLISRRKGERKKRRAHYAFRSEASRALD